MVHVALRIRKDLTKNPSHSNSWQEHVSQIMPNSLYLFLHLLFCDGDSLNEGIKEDNIIKQSVCNIAQNIVYAPSNKQKLNTKTYWFRACTSPSQTFRANFGSLPCSKPYHWYSLRN